MKFENELRIALDAGLRAAEDIETIYHTEFSVEWKKPEDPFTEADRRANELIVNAIREAFPDDAICAEEDGRDQAIAAAARGGRTWFVDPLDGTREFIAKVDQFCVMIGLAIDGAPVLGVVIEPSTHRVFSGIIGEGAWERLDTGPRLLCPSGQTDPRRTRLMVSRSRVSATTKALAERLEIPELIPCGSTGVKIAHVVRGDADAYVHSGGNVMLWDGCAPEAIARAAGLEVTDTLGRALSYHTSQLELEHGIIVASPALAKKLRAAL